MSKLPQDDCAAAAKAIAEIACSGFLHETQLSLIDKYIGPPAPDLTEQQKARRELDEFLCAPVKERN